MPEIEVSAIFWCAAWFCIGYTVTDILRKIFRNL